MKKTFCFDIDGVILTIVEKLQYNLAEPIEENIELINYLYKTGNRIILHTARGSKTGIDWTEVTTEQLRKWGVQYHELYFGKPSADHYIDDRYIDIEVLKKQVIEGEEK